LVTLSEPKDYIITLDVVEAIEGLRATKLSSELGFYRVVLECDASQIL